MLRDKIVMLTVGWLFMACTSVHADLENHYPFDDPANITMDLSGNGRHGFVDDLEVQWIEDETRGGVLEFGGSTNGFMVAEIPLLTEFTIMAWVYRDPTFCCGAGGANDGLFQVALALDDLEFLPPPPTGGTEKVIGGWVQKSDAAVWGRLVTEDIVANSLDRLYFMDDETWTHLAFRGDGEIFEVVVDGESGVGPALSYSQGLAEHDAIYIGRQGTETWGGRLDDFRVYSQALTDEEIQAIMLGGGGIHAPGDFNGDGQLDAADIDLLSVEVRQATNTLAYDLNNDQLVNAEDRTVWVEELANTFFGDSNLNREFNSGDFVAVFTAGKFETGQMASWAEGDWNGDGVFGSGDFVTAFTAGGYEQGPRAAVAIPEPASATLLLAAVLTMMATARHGRARRVDG
jgi:hypothetical protein